VAESARILHYNDHTMRYRVTKLERMLGGFIGDAAAALRIGAALHILRMYEIVADPRWCGGLSWRDLAAALRVSEHEPVFRLSLAVCCRRGDVDFCACYVVKPVPAPEGTR